MQTTLNRSGCEKGMSVNKVLFWCLKKVILIFSCTQNTKSLNSFSRCLKKENAKIILTVLNQMNEKLQVEFMWCGVICNRCWITRKLFYFPYWQLYWPTQFRITKNIAFYRKSRVIDLWKILIIEPNISLSVHRYIEEKMAVVSVGLFQCSQ